MGLKPGGVPALLGYNRRHAPVRPCRVAQPGGAPTWARTAAASDKSLSAAMRAMEIDVDLPFNGWGRAKEAIQRCFTKCRLRR